ncbi:hypothetical protein [Shouchella shacheensis]|nr:hypothetical protein [Shouchella shacheensis]
MSAYEALDLVISTATNVAMLFIAAAAVGVPLVLWLIDKQK